MRRLAILALVPWMLQAGDRWVKFTSGPFEVLTDGNTRTARETLVRLEEFRHALGQILGVPDLQTPMPVRVLLVEDRKAGAPSGGVAVGRDCYGIMLAGKGDVSPALYRDLTRLFLEKNTARMPASFERGLVEFFSTIQVNGIRITAGAPPPEPDLDWARVHLLIVDPEYYGRIRVLLYNLGRGVDPDPAYRNAFNKPVSAIETQARQHFEAGNFTSTVLSSRPLSAADFAERPMSDADARLARADLLAGAESATAYQELIRGGTKVAESEEGLGLLALRAGHADDARRHFQAAMSAGAGSARCYLEYARLEPDNGRALDALRRAAGINPKLAEIFALMAKRDDDPRMRQAHWKAAAEREPRNADYWQALAESYLTDHNYSEAAKAWTAGEQAAAVPEVRDRMRKARQAIEEQRLEYEAAEKRRRAEEEARELNKLKEQARAEVREIESKFNQSSEKPAAGSAVPWWDGPKPSGHVQGTLQQVDCLQGRARLVIRTGDGKTVRLLVTDPAKVAIIGGGEQALGCGTQKARRVTIEFFPKADARLATAGEVASIEFE